MASQTSRKRIRVASQRNAEPAPVLRATRSWEWLWLFLGAIGVAAFVYGPSLNGPFIFDDRNLPFSNPAAGEMPTRFWLGGVRPVLMASYWMNYLVSGAQPFSYHAVNIVIHAATAVLIYFILRSLIAISHSKLNPRIAPLFGAALFLVHPLESESVAYIAGRSELISGFFLCAAWLVFLKRFDSPNTTLATSVTILLLGVLAVLGKESAISLPAVVIITDWYFKPGHFADQIRRRLNLYVPIVLGGAAAAFFILRRLNSSAAGFSVAGVTPWQYALTQCKVVLTYVRLFFAPIGQSGDWQLAFYHSVEDPGARAYAVGMLLLLAIVFLTFRRARLFSFGIAVFLVLLLPTSSFVPISDALAERRVYVAIAGLIVAILAVVPSFQWQATTWKAVAAACLVGATLLANRRSQVWSSEVDFWIDAVAGTPTNSRAHLGLGDAYVARKQYSKAIGEFNLIERLEGPSEQVILNRAVAYELNQQLSEAEDALRKLAAMHPTANTYTRIAAIEGREGHVQTALAAIDHALALDGKSADAFANRGLIYAATHADDKAMADYQTALDIQPNHPLALYGMTQLLARQ